MEGVYKRMSDLTILYYTANKIPLKFATRLRQIIKDGSKDDIVSVSKQPIDFGDNHISPYRTSHVGVYKDILLGARFVKTKYVALAEDDTVYSPAHFKFRPKDGHFAYNLGFWSIFTWVSPAVFSFKTRRNNSNLICETKILIDTLSERLQKHPDEEKADLSIWGEPGRYEGHLGIKEYPTQNFYTTPANIMFSHEDGLQFKGLGTRKKLGDVRATSIPYWGGANKIM